MVGPLPWPCLCGSFSAPGCPFFEKSQISWIQICSKQYKDNKLISSEEAKFNDSQWECNLSAGAFATGWFNVLKIPFLYHGYSEG